MVYGCLRSLSSWERIQAIDSPHHGCAKAQVSHSGWEVQLAGVMGCQTHLIFIKYGLKCGCKCISPCFIPQWQKGFSIFYRAVTTNLNAAAPLVDQPVQSDLKQLIVPFVRVSKQNLCQHRTSMKELCLIKPMFWSKSEKENLVSSSYLRGLWVITTPLLNSSNGLFRSAVRLLLNNLIKLPCRSWNLKRRV